jgi:hypothetical protein
MRSFSVYFPNTDLIQKVEADSWDIDSNGYLIFISSVADGDGYKVKHPVAVFNMDNILGFREI